MSGAASVLNGNGAMVLNPAMQTAGGDEVFEADQIAEDQSGAAQEPALVIARAANSYPMMQRLCSLFLTHAPDIYALANAHVDKSALLLPLISFPTFAKSTGWLAMTVPVSRPGFFSRLLDWVLPEKKGNVPQLTHTGRGTAPRVDKQEQFLIQGATVEFTRDGAVMTVPAGKRVIFSLGRSDDGNRVDNRFIRMSGPHISRIHANLVVDTRDGNVNVCVQDVSTNGTSINGKLIHRDTENASDDEMVLLDIGSVSIKIRLLENRMASRRGALSDRGESTAREDLPIERPSSGRGQSVSDKRAAPAVQAVRGQPDENTSRQIDDMLSDLFPRDARIEDGRAQMTKGANDLTLTLPEGVDLNMATALANAVWRGVAKKMPVAETEEDLKLQVHFELMAQEDFDRRTSLYRMPLGATSRVRAGGITVVSIASGATTSLDLNVDENGVVGLLDKSGAISAAPFQGLRVHFMVPIDLDSKPDFQITRVNNAIAGMRRSVGRFDNAGGSIEDTVRQILGVF